MDEQRPWFHGMGSPAAAGAGKIVETTAEDWESDRRRDDKATAGLREQSPVLKEAWL